MSRPAPLNGLVLAGGRSRRMGRDKALLAHGDESQLAFAVRLLREVTTETYVSTRADQADEPERARFPQVVDQWDDLGPVAGILSALEQAPDTAWLVLACDLPNVTSATLQALVEGRDPARPFTAFRSVHNDLPEPLCAIFEPHARPLIHEFVGEGIRCPRKMMIRADAALLEQPDPDALANMNTPDDLRELQSRAS